MQIGSAVIMLQLLHGMTYPAHVKSLVSFLESNASLQKRGVSHDEWMMILQFFREVQADCSDYQVARCRVSIGEAWACHFPIDVAALLVSSAREQHRMPESIA